MRLPSDCFPAIAATWLTAALRVPSLHCNRRHANPKAAAHPSPPLHSPPLFRDGFSGIFLIDMALQFCIIYRTQAAATRPAGWVHEPRRIAIHYVSTWFVVDFFTFAISAVDIVALCYGGTCDGSAGGNVGNLRTLLLLRAFRLFKLLRLTRLSRILTRWETQLAINYAAVEMAKAFVQTFIVAHWFACLWGLQTLASPTLLDSWLGDKGYCVATTGGYDSVIYKDIDVGQQDIACVPHQKRYFAALYFSTMTITSIGYGDVRVQSVSVSVAMSTRHVPVHRPRAPILC